MSKSHGTARHDLTNRSVGAVAAGWSVRLDGGLDGRPQGHAGQQEDGSVLAGRQQGAARRRTQWPRLSALGEAERRGGR